MLRSIPRFLGVCVLTLLVLELVVRALVAAGAVPYRAYPETRESPFWANKDPVTGVWKPPLREFRHAGGCFDVVYRSNAFGMRDRERNLRSPASRRVALLGDSFVEGFGVAREQRFGDLLEAHEGVEYLNFGSSGHFGTIQAWLLYEKLAKRFDHTEVVFFVLPANDFLDNDPGGWRKQEYRPFLRREPGPEDDLPASDTAAFEVYYRVPFEERDATVRSWSKVLGNRIANASYLVNAWRWATREAKSLRLQGTSPRQLSYGARSPEELAVLEHSLRATIAAAGPRPFRLVLVPGEADVRAALEGEPEAPLVLRLRTFASTEGVEFLDLAPVFAREIRATGLDYRGFTLGCDPHWGPRGHAVVAAALAMDSAGTTSGADSIRID